MARREITQYFDDIDQTPLAEGEVHVVQFSIEGRDYVMDLSAENAAKFRQQLQPYMSVARTITGSQRGRRRGAGSHAQRSNVSREVRKWAHDNGFTVASRGKIPQEIYDAYYQAHSK